MLRRIFGPKKDKVTREWERLHNEELSDLNSSPSTIQVIKLRWVGYVACMGERRGQYSFLLGWGGEPEGKRPLGRPRHRLEDNIKMVLQEVGCEGMDWIELTQN